MTVARLRGRAGKRQRQRRLDRTDELCQMCRDAGRAELATVVDHIRPLALGGSDEDENTRNLCEAHHLEVTAEQFVPPPPSGRRRRGRVAPASLIRRNIVARPHRPGGGGSEPIDRQARTPRASDILTFAD